MNKKLFSILLLLCLVSLNFAQDEVTGGEVAPVVEVSAVDPPAVDLPVVDPPAVDTPVVDTPVADPPVVDTPAVDPPVADPPAVDPPVADPPAVDPPVADPPAVDPPVVEEDAGVPAEEGGVPAEEGSTGTTAEVISVPSTLPQVDERSRMTRCHDSCICEQTETKCAECNICSRCRQEEGTQIVGQSFCQCLTPQWRQVKGSWQCERVDISVDVPQCEWQLFNQIFNMVVHSNCSLEKDASGSNFVQDVLSYDWRRLSVELSDECKSQLRTRVLHAKDCQTYEPLNTQYVVATADATTTIRVALIDVYQLTSNTVLTDDGRTIYQVVCLAIELGHLRRVIREHRFQLRVYTNRDQVEVFHLTVTKQITEGCDKGQECIVVANLDTRGDICLDNSCNSFHLEGVVPVYTVGDHMYVRIQFRDNQYTQYLHVVSVKFVDDAGIYNYVRNVQWWTLRQALGSVDVDVLLFQPHVNAVVEVSLKIALQADSLRSLAESTVGQTVSQDFSVNVNKPETTTETKSAFSSQLVFGFALAVFALLF